MPEWVLFFAIFVAGAVAGGLIETIAGWGAGVVAVHLAHKLGFGQKPCLQVKLSDPVDQGGQYEEYLHLVVANDGLKHSSKTRPAQFVTANLVLNGNEYSLAWRMEGARARDIRDILRGRPAFLPLIYCVKASAHGVGYQHAEPLTYYLTESQFLLESTGAVRLAPGAYSGELLITSPDCEDLRAVLEFAIPTERADRASLIIRK